MTADTSAISPQISDLGQIRAARLALERANTIEDVREVLDIADAALAYLRRRRDSLDTQNSASLIRLGAERKLGGMLDESPRGAGGRPSKNPAQAGPSLAAVLREHGIAPSVARRWMREAAVPEADYQSWLADTMARGEEITSAGLLAYAAGGRTPSGNTEWYTGVEVGAAIGRFWGHADLDPCAPEGGPPNVPVRRYYTRADNGLLLPWDAVCVFTNPPYPPDEWVDKGLAEVATGNVRELILLVAGALSPAWWARLSPYPYWSPLGHRLTFSSPHNPGESGPNFASVAFYIGPDVAGFVAAFGEAVYRRIDGGGVV